MNQTCEEEEEGQNWCVGVMFLLGLGTHRERQTETRMLAFLLAEVRLEAGSWM